MTDTLTDTVRLTEPTIGGDGNNVWPALLNSNFEYIDEAINQTIDVAVADVNVTLVSDGGSTDEARYLRYNFTGALTADRTVTIPANQKVGWATNNTTGGKNIILSCGGVTLNITSSAWTFFVCDGTDVTAPTISFASLSTPGTLSVTGASTLTGAVTASGTLSVAGTTTLKGGFNWSSANYGKQLEITTTASGSNPAIAVTGADGTDLWAIAVDSSDLVFASMPAYSDSTTAPIKVIELSSTSVALKKNTAVTGTFSASGAATLSSTLGVTGNTTIGGTLGVTGASTFTSGTFSTTLGVTGAATLSSTLAVTGNTTVGGTLGVTGASTLTGATSIAGELTLTAAGNALQINNNANITGTLNVNSSFSAAATTLSSTLAVTGGTTLSGGLDLTGTTTFENGFTVKTTNSGTFETFNIAGGAQVGSINSNGGGGVNYSSLSDQRLKDDEGAVTESGWIIDRLKPRWFRWKTHPDGIPEAGFFAQQVARIFPQAVTRGAGRPGRKNFRPWQMDAGKMMPLVIAELQALRRRVAELERGR